MTLDEALSKAVAGFKVRRFGMAEGNYLYYNFQGFELAKGKFEMSDEDKAGDWYVIDAIAPEGTNWDVEAAIDKPEDDVIFVPSCWEPEPIFIAKPDTVKAGWEMFDRARDYGEQSS
jgi:hypothetical protein